MEGIDLLRLAARELAEGRRVAESVVLESSGSVARPAGARMLTLESGESVGTVGGGAPELRCQRMAREALEGGPARLVTLDHASTGMVCGGSQLVGIRALGAADLAVLDAALAVLDAGGQGELVTAWPQGGDPSLAFAAVDDAMSFVEVPEGRVELCGEQPRFGEGRFVELLCAPERAFVFGGGHVGRALVPVLASIGLEVTLVDNRPEVAREELFPAARHVVLGDYRDVAASVAIRPRDYVCVMTHGHASDEDVVGQVLARHPRYLGCMGSRRKRAVLLDVLEARGIDRELAASVELPIGLSIGAVTPAEIAVSIAARIIEVRAGAAGEQVHAGVAGKRAHASEAGEQAPAGAVGKRAHPCPSGA